MRSVAGRSSVVSRRGFVKSGAAAALGMVATSAGGGDSPRSGAGKAKAVILVFNSGAPSHLDLWDPKPDAADTVRGPFDPIPTAVPGVRVSRLLPRLAKLTDRYAVVRTLHHKHTQHNSGMHWSIVGRPYPVDSTLINPSRTDHPSVGTLVGWLSQRDGHTPTIPPYVITPAPHCDSTAYITPGQFGGCLGGQYDPYVLNADPNAADFRPTFGGTETPDPARLGGRQTLLTRLDTTPAIPDEFQDHRRAAFDLVGSAAVRRAFDLGREPPATRDRYGRHPWGQSHLLARRLVEAGSRFVTTVNGPSIVWDTHQDNFRRMESRLVPPMEQAFAALLTDLEDRGLLDTTLVVWLGDFGRTPVINKEAGRDHWPQCYSAVLAGGGVGGGQVVGASDSIGAYPKDRPVTPADLHATIFTALGYDPHAITYPSADGRPFPLTDGTPIRELL
jgi:hypothetical protein